MGFKQYEIDDIFKLKYEKKLKKDLNRLYKIIIDDAVNYYSNNGRSKDLKDYQLQISSIMLINWIEIRNKFMIIINKMLVGTDTNKLLNNIANNSFNNYTYKNILQRIQNETIQLNTIGMQNIVNQTSIYTTNTNNKKFEELSFLGLSVELFRKKLTDSYKNRIPTIATTFTQIASEKTKSDYTKLINNTISKELPQKQLTKTWVTKEDDHVREAHVLANGQTVNISDFYVVWDELLEIPGDTRYSSIQNTIKCRCSSIVNF
tara:strand:+ start:587 stop:1372 length:786 start_codon:yes stop_codon:yes gene_type:complete